MAKPKLTTLQNILTRLGTIYNDLIVNKKELYEMLRQFDHNIGDAGNKCDADRESNYKAFVEELPQQQGPSYALNEDDQRRLKTDGTTRSDLKDKVVALRKLGVKISEDDPDFLIIASSIIATISGRNLRSLQDTRDIANGLKIIKEAKKRAEQFTKAWSEQANTVIKQADAIGARSQNTLILSAEDAATLDQINQPAAAVTPTVATVASPQKTNQ